MYLPNPIAIGLVKTAMYFALGAGVRMRGRTPGHAILRPIAFSIVRTALGWLIGAPVLLAAIFAFSELSYAGVVAVLALPRFMVSYVVIQKFFQPRGGRRETGLWAASSVALASIVDLVLLSSVETVSWLRIAWC